MEVLNPAKLLEKEVLEIRGDGKAGGGLVLAMQSLAGVLIRNSSLHVQEWPFFSTARKGAATRSFLRVSRQMITIAAEVEHPHISILMDAGAAHFVDFAEGVPKGGTFILNTNHSPEDCAKHYRLSGKILTIDGDALGLKYLKAPIGNISVFATLIYSISSLSKEVAAGILMETFKKRRFPENICNANMELFEASFHSIRQGIYDYALSKDHQLKPFDGYGKLTAGAQASLRLSRTNYTANYARSGARIVFVDPDLKCNGCAVCIVNCPENIIRFVPDESRGVLVIGADFGTYCKQCRECVENCPEKLFLEEPYQEQWNDLQEGGN